MKSSHKKIISLSITGLLLSFTASTQKTLDDVLRSLLRAATAFTLLLFLAPSANAVVVYSQTPIPDGLDFAESPTGTCCLTADDFLLTSTVTINKVIWQGAMAPDDTPAPVDDFTIKFYADSGTAPGALISSFAVGHADRVTNGTITDRNGTHILLEHTASLGAGITLGAGTYWIAIINSTNLGLLDSRWFWAVDFESGVAVLNDLVQSNNAGATWNLGPYPQTTVFTLETVPLNESPIAEAGINQSIHVGQNVLLDGSGSADDNTASEDLLYDWSFNTRPLGSTAALVGADTLTPSFIADQLGDYVISLVVTDEGALSSGADTVTVSSSNTPPTADAGLDQGTYVGNTVVLDGSGSSDADLDLITYSWSLISQPVGSGAVLIGTTSATPEFIPDLAGIYVAQLIVNDNYNDSAPAEVNIAVITVQQFAQQKVLESLNIVSNLPTSSFTKKGNQTALGKTLGKVIDNLQKGKEIKATKKLSQAIERTDGCALRGGSPDTGGGGSKKDYINNCTDQAVIYPVLIDALNALM